MTTIRRILCATDLSQASEPAWDEAQRLARLFGAELVLLHVVPPLPIPLEGYFPPQMYQELAEGASREARAALEGLLARRADPGVKAWARVEEGGAAQRILEVAREESVDLVVVGTHGRTGFGRILLGSIADRVVRVAPCPVLTVRPRPAGTAAPVAITRVLFATDFSPSARAAWPWAVAIAEAASAELDLLHVTAQPVPDRHLAPDVIGRMARVPRSTRRARSSASSRTGSSPGGRRGPAPRARAGPDPRPDRPRRRRRADRPLGPVPLGQRDRDGHLRDGRASCAGCSACRAPGSADRPCSVLTVGPEGGEERPHAS
jgi:nucleotide-binding universal stress UspA family protein